MRSVVHPVLRSMLVLALISMMILLLAVGSSDAPAMGANPVQFVVQTKCPPLKRYSAEQSKQIGQARQKLRAADPGNVLLGVTDDYSRLREQCRAIEPPAAAK